MTAAEDVQRGRVLVIRPGATRLDDAEGETELVWPEEGRRITLGRKAMHILTQFAVPASVDAVAERLDRAAPGSSGAVRKTVAALVDAGALCAQETARDATAVRRTGMFGAPVVGIADALNGPADFVVIGAPYDHGVTYRPGARFGPEALRRASTTVFQTDGHGRGMYDPESGGRLLAGAGIVDIGDVSTRPGAFGGDLLDGLEEVTALTAHRGKVPVVLGGDHSLTLRVVDGLKRRHRRLGVLHFDAHHDFGRIRTGERTGVHHGNFLDWVVGDEAVRYVAQFGVRQLTADEPERSDKLRRWPGMTALDTDAAALARELPDGLVWHLTFDVDVLDPAVMPSTGTVLPGGYTYRQAVSLVAGLCDVLPVVGLDLVEYLPGAEEAPGVTVTALCARAMHHIAAARRRTR